MVDGNYSVVCDLVSGWADTLVWLDYSIGVVLRRLMKRSAARVFGRRELWNGNRERFQEQFMSRESLFVWALKTHRQKRRDYQALLRDVGYAHLQVVTLASPSETSRWLSRLPQRTAGVAGHGAA